MYPVAQSPPSWRILSITGWSHVFIKTNSSVISTSELVYLLRLHPLKLTPGVQNPEKITNFVKPTHHVNKTCPVCLTNIHSFMLQTKHFHWSNRHSCLGNCLVWKINMHKKTFTLHGWMQMVVSFLIAFHSALPQECFHWIIWTDQFSDWCFQ